MTIIRIIRKFRPILSRHQKFRILELGILMIIGGFMEMLSVSLILPFMEAVIDPDKIMSNQIVSRICSVLGIESNRTFLVFLAIIMALLYIVKNIFLLFQMLVQNRFVQNNRFFAQRRLLRSYLSIPYEFFLDIKSGDVLQVINNDTLTVFSLLSNLLMLFSELVVSGSLIITILIMSPGITFGVAALMLAMVGIIQMVIQPILSKVGKESRTANAGTQQWLIQAIQGIKELKIMRSESFFEDKYNKCGSVAVKTSYISATLGLVPRFMIEAVSMASFFFIIAFMIYQGTALEALLPMLSGVAMAAIRLLPSVNRITTCLASVVFSEPALDKMAERLAGMNYLDESINSGKDIAPQPLGIINGISKSIEMDDVSYRYPNGEKNVIDDSGFVIEKGQSVGIVGSSGAGKTTAVDIILGLLIPHSGTVKVDGIEIKDDMGGWLNQIGYIPQTIFMLDGDIRSNVAFGKDKDDINDDRVWAALKEASIDAFVKGLPEGLNTEIGERGVRLSGGQRQRIGIARALYNDPEILFFDEATSALDNETETAIMESINNLQGTKTMIIIAHRLTTIEKCDVIYRVENGKILKER